MSTLLPLLSLLAACSATANSADSEEALSAAWGERIEDRGRHPSHLQDADPALTPASGYWRLQSARVLEDPCELDDRLLSRGEGAVLRDQLPGSFEISGGAEGFQLEAMAQGDSGRVSCLYQGGSFRCEPQPQLSQGGWRYRLALRGQVADSEHLRVQGRLDQLQREPELNGAPDEAWETLTGCRIELSMELSWSDW